MRNSTRRLALLLCVESRLACASQGGIHTSSRHTPRIRHDSPRRLARVVYPNFLATLHAPLVLVGGERCSMDRSDRCLTMSAPGAALLGGRESEQQMVDEMQPKAVQVARQRRLFELNCPTATAEAPSKEMMGNPAASPGYAVTLSARVRRHVTRRQRTNAQRAT